MGRAFFVAADIFFPALVRGGSVYFFLRPMFFVGAATGAAVARAFFVRPHFFSARCRTFNWGGGLFLGRPWGAVGQWPVDFFLAEFSFRAWPRVRPVIFFLCPTIFFCTGPCHSVGQCSGRWLHF